MARAADGQGRSDCCSDTPSAATSGKGGNPSGGPLPLDCDCGRPRFLTSDLFVNGCDELCIDHNGEKYTLRITRQNKLILNK